ncbi:hypothetical protein SAMN02745216_02686 [Desulfatibacillum alkenivorans DSM 16219]|jgi:hypothetical protein|uniref:Uncharacterized protein n=1 Tax=Desulfatibacillum alkenivorans DSM 16219 TaxID=1121393 RepID=A0A1M6NWV6_9BACT|nr:hypothetical protein [Desulfatibacillum alkenivorans]SHK00173.1 hypothetical protein SAMN02745216_02686 [Desulfatibacillum alkenivorans DSM 16219]
MAKREKFIVIVAILAVLGYGATFLFSGGGGDKGRKASASKTSQGKDPAAELAELRKSIEESQTKVGKAKPEELAVYIVANSEAPFPQDPFYYRIKVEEPEEAKEVEEEIPTPSIALFYTGFIQIGGKRMAIINNLEYEVGDDVAATGFLLKSIHQDRVEIVSREGTFTSLIPYVEEGL